MSMLSEQRRKTKWVVNPTKKPLWSTDSSGIKFGKELMEKMGWSAGKGLGLKEQGIQEPLRVSFKNDTKGMGFKGNDDDWIGHQDEFNSLLSQLRTGEDSSVVKISEEEKREVKSLEEKSKTSKARVHYQKFTRGKDLSKYSENDLACIIGTNKMKKEKPKTEEIIRTESTTNGSCETSFGVTTINSGSLQDYFKRKWIINKNKSNGSNGDSIENSAENITNEKSSTYNGQSIEESEEKKSKKKKHKSESEEQLPIEDKISQSDVLESSDKVEKRKRKKMESDISLDSEPVKKKKRKNSDNNGAFEGEISPENDSIESSNLTFENQHLDSFPKKRKKEKNYLTSEIANNEDSSSCVREKKKRKKSEKNSEETSALDEALSEEIYATNNDECKLSKKKSKKEKTVKNAIETAQSYSNKEEPPPIQSDAPKPEIYTKSKKIKKSKKENSEENEMKSMSADLKEYSSPGETVQQLNIAVENDENTSSKKKKKKKDNKEKSTEEELNCLDLGNKKSSGIEVENPVEVEPRKKKKKERKENNCSNENEESLYENISEEPEKKKKKKTDKKEKSAQPENEKNETDPEEREGESVKKKKKKKKEKLQERHESQQSCQIEPNEEPKLEKSGTEKIHEGMNSSQTENNPVNGSKTEGEKRIEKLKVNLFGDEVSVKYFPQKGPNERVLKLIKWANFSGFRGSNLRDVEGYGRKVMYQRQIS